MDWVPRKIWEVVLHMMLSYVQHSSTHCVKNLHKKTSQTLFFFNVKRHSHQKSLQLQPAFTVAGNYIVAFGRYCFLTPWPQITDTEPIKSRKGKVEYNHTKRYWASVLSNFHVINVYRRPLTSFFYVSQHVPFTICYAKSFKCHVSNALNFSKYKKESVRGKQLQLFGFFNLGTDWRSLWQWVWMCHRLRFSMIGYLSRNWLWHQNGNQVGSVLVNLILNITTTYRFRTQYSIPSQK